MAYTMLFLCMLDNELALSSSIDLYHLHARTWRQNHSGKAISSTLSVYVIKHGKAVVGDCMIANIKSFANLFVLGVGKMIG